MFSKGIILIKGNDQMVENFDAQDFSPLLIFFWLAFRLGKFWICPETFLELHALIS